MIYRQAILKYTKCLLDPTQKNLAPANIFYSQTEGGYKNKDVALTLIKFAIEDILLWTPQEAATRLNKKVISEMKLDDAIEKLNLPDGCIIDNNYTYVLNMIYPQIRVNVEDLTKKYYQYVLDDSNNKSFTRRFFEGKEGKYRALICLHYLIERNVAFFESIDDMYEYFSGIGGDRFLTQNKLNLAKQVFSSNTEYLHYALSQSQRDDFLFHYYQSHELYWNTKRKLEKISRATKKIKKQAEEVE